MEQALASRITLKGKASEYYMSRLLWNRSGHRKLFPSMVIPPNQAFPHSERIKAVFKTWDQFTTLSIAQQPAAFQDSSKAQYFLYSQRWARTDTHKVSQGKAAPQLLWSPSIHTERRSGSNPQLSSRREGSCRTQPIPNWDICALILTPSLCAVPFTMHKQVGAVADRARKPL